MTSSLFVDCISDNREPTGHIYYIKSERKAVRLTSGGGEIKSCFSEVSINKQAVGNTGIFVRVYTSELECLGRTGNTSARYLRESLLRVAHFNKVSAVI